MIFRQYYLQCLSHASYLVGDETSGRAVVVDPQRDVAQYLEDAEREHLHIERVIETHFHADFVSGHLELAAATGAAICYGEPAEAGFPIERLADGTRIPLGDVVLEVIATPGHTPESISLAVYEHADDTEAYAVLTGDTLFIGDVGRPDLLASAGMSAESLARLLYRSLHQRILALPDSTRVYPAHGAGSACGRSLSTETWSTIGEQRRTNYALAPVSEDDFVRTVTDGQPVAPAYFPYDANRNREMRPLLAEEEAPPALSLDEVLRMRDLGAVVLDTRDPADFAAGHLLGSLNVGLDGRFAEYAGDLLDPHDRVVLVCDPGHELEARIRLARIGFDSVAGHLATPLLAFLDRPDQVRRASRLTAAALEERMRSSKVVVVDVRNPQEAESAGSIEGSLAIPLPRLVAEAGALGRYDPVVVYCASGFRSSSAASLLRARGFEDVSDLVGGHDAWRARHATAGTG